MTLLAEMNANVIRYVWSVFEFVAFRFNSHQMHNEASYVWHTQMNLWIYETLLCFNYNYTDPYKIIISLTFCICDTEN